MAKIYGIVAFFVSALERRLGGNERRHVNLPVMMLALSVRSYAGVVGCGSALKHDVHALDHTHVNVQTKNVAETANQAKNEKQNRKKRKISSSFFIRNRE